MFISNCWRKGVLSDAFKEFVAADTGQALSFVMVEQMMQLTLVHHFDQLVTDW